MAWPEFVARGYLRKLMRQIAPMEPIPSAGVAKPERLVLVTSCGVHLRTDVPFDVASETGDSSWREFPWIATPAELAISHPHYDHGLVTSDWETALPRRILEGLVIAGRLRGLHDRVASFMGFVTRLDEFRAGAACVASELRRAEVDAALLTPC
ncbi:MAG: hypothetical protein KDC38_13230 [Planctomycetes bacterium]|nr:hypothetical protein [Planctomycetota bacterium]